MHNEAVNLTNQKRFNVYYGTYVDIDGKLIENYVNNIWSNFDFVNVLDASAAIVSSSLEQIRLQKNNEKHNEHQVDVFTKQMIRIEEQINSLEKVVKQKDDQINSLRNDLKQRDDQVQQLQKELKTQMKANVKLEAKMDDLDRKYAEEKLLRETLTADMMQLQKEITMKNNVSAFYE